MSLRDLLGMRAKPPDAQLRQPPPATGLRGTGEGVFGKVPWQADFLRFNAGAFSAAGFEGWLEDGVGELTAAGLSLPDEDFGEFLLCPKGAAVVCVGVLGSSRDQVGRSFPLTVFRYGSAPAGKECMSSTDGEGYFLDHGQSRLANIAGEPSSVPLAGRNGETVVHDSSDDLPSEMAFAAMGARAVLEELFFGHANIGTGLRELQFALMTLESACLTVAGEMPERARITLELPASRVRDVVLWCQVADALLRWPSGIPSWIWSRSSGRLLMSLGPPCAELLLEWGRPGRPGPRHWVIRAESKLPPSPSAVLSPGCGELADPTFTVAMLLRLLGSAKSP